MLSTRRCQHRSAIEITGIFATADGKVKFGKHKGRKLVEILTLDTLETTETVDA